MNAAWVVCEMCEDLYCRVHGGHVADCPCPPIDEWVEAGYDPYDEEVTEGMTQWLAGFSSQGDSTDG